MGLEKNKEPGFNVGDNVQYIENNHFYTVEKKNTEYFLTSPDHTSGFWTDEKKLRGIGVAKFEVGTPLETIPGVDNGTALTSKHYNLRPIQTIEVAQMVLTKEEFIGAMKFNILKYTQRAGTKDGEGIDKDFNKASQYALWLEAAQKGEKIDPRSGR